MDLVTILLCTASVCLTALRINMTRIKSNEKQQRVSLGNE